MPAKYIALLISKDIFPDIGFPILKTTLPKLYNGNHMAWMFCLLMQIPNSPYQQDIWYWNDPSFLAHTASQSCSPDKTGRLEILFFNSLASGRCGSNLTVILNIGTRDQSLYSVLSQLNTDFSLFSVHCIYHEFSLLRKAFSPVRDKWTLISVKTALFFK